jgi:hypothetical protein
MWNPFRYFADQRAADREAFLLALDKILAGQNHQAEVAIEQSRSLRAFVDSFLSITEAPVRRVSTDETEAQAEEQAWGLYGES